MKKVIFTVVALLTMAALINGCGSKKEPDKKEKIFPVEVKNMDKERISLRLNAIGTVSSQTIVNVVSPEEGKVSEFLAAEGDKVDENQIVAKISSNKREALVSTTLGKLKFLQKELGVCADENKREELKAKIEEIEQELDFALRQYQETIITSPVKGTVTKCLVDQGDIVSAKSKLMKIADMDNLIVLCNIPELDIVKIKHGQKVKISIDALGQEILNGKISKIYPAVEEATRSVPVEINIVDDNAALKVGMFARPSIIIEEKNTFVLPRDAITEQLDGRKIVFKVENGIAQKTQVKTGIREKDRIEITSGVENGDLIVVNGQHSLKEGVKVKIIKE